MYDELKRDIRIGTVLRRYGYYAPDRQSYRIACPIHGGRNLSFSVSEVDGLWNCFSKCDHGGSVIDLVASLEKISIKEAAEKLAHDFNVMPAQSSIATARMYSNQLERFKKLKEDVKVELPPHRMLEPGYRGFTLEVIKHWGLARTDDGVLIPLVSKGGKPCSYSIRRDDGKPKYSNAPGMSKCWPFGLYQNMQAIINEGFSYIVEGQLDAVTMWQYGYRNVVAIMGSQVSEQQAMLLLSVVPTLMLVMDGDEAGRKASKEIVKKWGDVFSIGRIDLPEGIDPDDYLIKGGRF